jgi:hypothetical protein
MERFVHRTFIVVVFAAVAAGGCASAPVAFSANAVESRIVADRGPRPQDSALELRFGVVNRTHAPETVSLGAESVHIESVTRNGKAVAPEDREAKLPDDPRTLLHETLPVVEAEGETAFFVRAGLSDLVLVDGVWHRRVFPLTRGKYRVVFSYHYDGPDDGKPNVFHGRIVARPISFRVD